jgi:inorganic pyrophosphatase
MIGKIVKVHIDRPLGSYHPDHSDLYYEVNYGYIENTCACDGDEINAYVLGIDVPVTSFQGRVIAIIHRLDDVEDKLIVAPINMNFSDQEIIKMTHFQERFFHSVIIR